MLYVYNNTYIIFSWATGFSFYSVGLCIPFQKWLEPIICTTI